MQRQGGISRLWHALLPRLSMRFNLTPLERADVFLSTYYRRAPFGIRSLVLVYDMIAERYPLIGRYHPDAIDKRYAIANATKVIAISQQTACDVEKLMGRTVDAIAYPGIEPDFGIVRADAVEQFQSFIGKPYFLIVGKRGLYKNVQVLYQAWGSWKGHEQYAIVCVGGEPNLPADIAFDNKFPGVRKPVILEDADLPLAYAGAVALVYPSLIEGFGLPALEAMACHCPVIGGETLREVCGEYAHYVDVTRPKDIQRGLDAVVSDKKPSKVHTEAFCWDKMADTMSEVIRSMV